MLELGSGTSLPGVVAAKCGARVTLSDCSRFTKCLDNCRTSAAANAVSDKVSYLLKINFVAMVCCFTVFPY